MQKKLCVDVTDRMGHGVSAGNSLKSKFGFMSNNYQLLNI